MDSVESSQEYCVDLRIVKLFDILGSYLNNSGSFVLTKHSFEFRFVLTVTHESLLKLVKNKPREK